MPYSAIFLGVSIRHLHATKFKPWMPRQKRQVFELWNEYHFVIPKSQLWYSDQIISLREILNATRWKDHRTGFLVSTRNRAKFTSFKVIVGRFRLLNKLLLLHELYRVPLAIPWPVRILLKMKTNHQNILAPLSFCSDIASRDWDLNHSRGQGVVPSLDSQRSQLDQSFGHGCIFENQIFLFCSSSLLNFQGPPLSPLFHRNHI